MSPCVCACVQASVTNLEAFYGQATEASVIGQAMPLLVLKGFTQQRGHPRVIPPFVG